MASTSFFEKDRPYDFVLIAPWSYGQETSPGAWGFCNTKVLFWLFMFHLI
jgi:hypothetical protein